MNIRTSVLVVALFVVGCGESGGKVESAEKAKASAGPDATKVADVVSADTSKVSAAVDGPGDKQKEATRRRSDIPRVPDGASDGSRLVAWDDKHKISEKEFSIYLSKLPPHQAREYAALEKKMDMLKNMVRLEILAELAMQEGLDKDPEVILAMKGEMAKKYLIKKFSNIESVQVSEEEIRAQYERDIIQYKRPERVRASQIFIRDRAKAEQVLAELRIGVSEAGVDRKRVFREAVAKYSEDDKTRRRGGDLQQFTKEGKTDGDMVIDPAVVGAAFAMQTTEQVSNIIEGKDGFYIIMVTSRRAGVDRPYEDAREEIRASIAQERLDTERVRFTEALVDFDTWHFEADVIDSVTVPGGGAGSGIDDRVNSAGGKESVRGVRGKDFQKPKADVEPVPSVGVEAGGVTK